MKDSRKERELLATFLVAGLAAVVGNHFIGPIIRKGIKK